MKLLLALAPLVQTGFKRRAIQADVGIKPFGDDTERLHRLVFRLVVEEELAGRKGVRDGKGQRREGLTMSS